jgi:outer membrane protein OmpA-like peptidoglycan-associated protein
MMTPESARRSGGVANAMPAGLRTTLAVGLLVLGVGDLAAIDGILLPRYLAGRSQGAGGPRLASTRTWIPPTAALSPQAVEQSPPPPASAPLPAAPAVRAEPVPIAPTSTPPPVVEQPKAEPTSAAGSSEASAWPNLLFARNTSWLSPASRETLDSLAARLKEEAGLHVVLAGHTDDLGTPELNHSLSLDRAVHAQAWLVDHGIGPERIEVRHFGSAKPTTSGQTAEARAQNRRVEITLRERSR